MGPIGVPEVIALAGYAVIGYVVLKVLITMRSKGQN
jgi:hypothetical protein